MARFEPILNNAKLEVVSVKIYVKPVWKKLKNPKSVLGGSIPGPPNLAILGGSGEVWAPLGTHIGGRGSN
jgi:hypothetical protein